MICLPAMPSDLQITQILKKVRQVEIRTHRLVTDALAGAYHSVFKGQGMDFEEVREYTAGDDVRSIDWNVTAKMGRPFIKKFREERELTLMLVVDLSRSGLFSSIDQSKRELAAEIGSVLAFSATRNSDKVGLLLFTDRVEKFIAPQKGRQHVLRVIREMLFFEPQGVGTDISGALDYLNKVLNRRSVTFLLSDFLENSQTSRLSDTLFNTFALTNRRHDLVCTVLSDPREIELPNVGVLTFEDAETGELVEIDTASKSIRSDYSRENRARFDTLFRNLRQRGIDVIDLSTDRSYQTALNQFFAHRAHRR